MPDLLYDAIAHAIDQPLGGDLFERCAVELLREWYCPTLRPVEGGGDAGMDGVGELPNRERFFLVSTVGEGLAVAELLEAPARDLEEAPAAAGLPLPGPRRPP